MGRRAVVDYDSLLDRAEGDGMCLVTKEKSENRQLNRLVERGELISPLQGMFVRPDYWKKLSYGKQHLHMVKALSRQHPDWIFSHHTAALVYGLYVSYPNIRKFHRSVVKNTSASHALYCNHVVGERCSDIVDGVRVTELDQTLFDCLRNLDFKDGLAIADSACRFKGMNPEKLLDILDSFGSKRCPGIRVAKLSANNADARSESGGESIARATMIMNGFKVPELQVLIPDPIGDGKFYRADFLWELPYGGKVVGELDGREKYVNEEMTHGEDIVDILREERLRESRINTMVARVMRMSFSDVVNERRFIQLLELFGIPQVNEPWPDDLRRRFSKTG